VGPVQSFETVLDKGVLEVEAEKQEEKVDPEEGWKTKDTGKRPGLTYPGSKTPVRRRGGVDYGEANEGEQVEYAVWRWWPTWHHIYEIWYLSCSVQLFGATLYSICALLCCQGF
jgi:hypothetical protein